MEKERRVRGDLNYDDVMRRHDMGITKQKHRWSPVVDHDFSKYYGQI